MRAMDDFPLLLFILLDCHNHLHVTMLLHIDLDSYIDISYHPHLITEVISVQDNPSEKDINQGTLVIFNLDSSVSNDELRQIFGVYGEIKEVILFTVFYTNTPSNYPFTFIPLEIAVPYRNTLIK